MNLTKHKKGWTVALLLSCGALLFLLSGSISSRVWGGERRLSEKDLSYEIEQAKKYYKMFLDEDGNISQGLQDMQKILRLQRQCDYPEKEEEAEPENGVIHVNADHPDSHLTTISCVEVHYRIPESSIQDIDDSIVFGVISGGVGNEKDESRARREAIRKTWGKDKKVFFLVAGPWFDNVEEYEEYKDILWVDMPEEKYAHPTNGNKGALPFKTETFLFAMYQHVILEQDNKNVEYFFKTDDDCYIDTDQLEKEIYSAVEEGKRFDYGGGQCMDKQPPIRDEWNERYIPYLFYPYNHLPTYCVGSGYVLSRYFLECAVTRGHIERTVYIRSEAVAVGLLAEKCGLEPQFDLFSMEIENGYEFKDVTVQDNVRTPDQIEGRHSMKQN